MVLLVLLIVSIYFTLFLISDHYLHSQKTILVFYTDSWSFWVSLVFMCYKEGLLQVGFENWWRCSEQWSKRFGKKLLSCILHLWVQRLNELRYEIHLFTKLNHLGCIINFKTWTILIQISRPRKCEMWFKYILINGCWPSVQLSETVENGYG